MIEEYLKLLEKDLAFYQEAIKEVSDDIIKNQFSEYPIFVAAIFDYELGELILDAKELSRVFNIYATYLEELEKKNIIPSSKVTFFKNAYKDANTNACILFISNEKQQFIFYPYKNLK